MQLPKVSKRKNSSDGTFDTLENCAFYFGNSVCRSIVTSTLWQIPSVIYCSNNLLSYRLSTSILLHGALCLLLSVTSALYKAGAAWSVHVTRVCDRTTRVSCSRGIWIDFGAAIYRPTVKLLLNSFLNILNQFYCKAAKLIYPFNRERFLANNRNCPLFKNKRNPYCHLSAVFGKTQCLSLAGRENRSPVKMPDVTIDATDFDDIGRTLNVRPHMSNKKKDEKLQDNQKILILDVEGIWYIFSL